MTHPILANELDVALGLLADHELATSTLAARVAASTGADPYAVMTAGVSALGGPRHGSASAGAYDLLRDALAGRPVVSFEHLPGFGHAVYVDVDPRATVLLDRVAQLDDRVSAAATISRSWCYADPVWPRTWISDSPPSAWRAACRGIPAK